MCVSKLETETIGCAFLLEVVHSCCIVFIGIIIVYVKKKNLICKWCSQCQSSESLFQIDWSNLSKSIEATQFSPTFLITVVIVTISSLCGIAIMQVNIPIAQIALFFAFLCVAVGGNVVSAVMVEIYPTALRYAQIWHFLLNRSYSLPKYLRDYRWFCYTEPWQWIFLWWPADLVVLSVQISHLHCWMITASTHFMCRAACLQVSFCEAISITRKIEAYFKKTRLIVTTPGKFSDHSIITFHCWNFQIDSIVFSELTIGKISFILATAFLAFLIPYTENLPKQDKTLNARASIMSFRWTSE